MCGIFGSISKNKIIIDNNILPHRGPDDWGVKYSNINGQFITFFHSRLSIIGLGEQGHQPFTKDENNILVFNGEIYNYKEIREKLISDFKINFKTFTDTEVLYEAIVTFGIKNTLELLNGMFAFAFLDKKMGEIFIVRDNLGIKPLYYYFNKDHFYFSSECKVFFNLNLIKPKLNTQLMGEYFANGWVYEPDTLFQDVYKLEAGNYLKVSINDNSVKIHKKKYWSINNYIKNKEVKEAILEQAKADVPIGAYLSGGVDSSIVSYYLKNKNILNLNLDLKDSESKRVKLFDKKFDVNIKKIYYKNESLEIYKKLIFFMDEPIADPAVIPAYQLADESRKLKRIVMMSGMGGDEIDAGYSRHRIITNIRKYMFLKYIPNILIGFLFSGKFKRDLLRLRSFVTKPVPENYYSLTSYFTKKEITNLLDEKWYLSYSRKIRKIVSEFESNKKYFALDIKGFLASHNLIYMDKASMAASIEVRVPLLDKAIVVNYFKDIDMKKNVNKRRLKNELKKALGKDYWEIKKEGFRYPISKWLKNEIDWSEIINFFEEKQLIKTSMIKKWLEILESDYKQVEMKLWSIYTLFLWIKTFNVEK